MRLQTALLDLENSSSYNNLEIKNKKVHLSFNKNKSTKQKYLKLRKFL